jgi:hypothetical protein
MGDYRRNKKSERPTKNGQQAIPLRCEYWRSGRGEDSFEK